MFKIILLIVMLLAFISNFTVPKFLKNKYGDGFDIAKANNIKLLSLLIVIICAILLIL